MNANQTRPAIQNQQQTPQSGSRTTAGFPSPSDDYLETPLDLNRLLIKRPAATFFMRASGNALREAGIRDHDLLIIDRASQVTHGAIIVALVDGELQLQRFTMRPQPNAETDDLLYETPYEIWGVVTCVIRELS